MPAPKCKEEANKNHKKRQTVYDAEGNWTVFQRQDNLRQLAAPLFTTYYRDTQAITGADPAAFERFMTFMRTPLETTIWINDTDPLAAEVSAYFGALPPTLVEPIPWYPLKGMAWRIHSDKVALRKDPQLADLRQFMIRQTAMGTISRQEEVSMIPPFLLDIQENDACLDMCASPGSKTAQMLVALGRHKQARALAINSPFPFDYLSEGFVVANELDTARANMLVHQVKRLRLLFPFALFSNHDARFYPELGTAEAPQKFDKILCDVVCSGDGTIRKSPFIFKVWSPKEALKLQKIQIQIALRACYLLKIGGRMVYSTCSLNPIENEAVVSQILHRTGGAMRLVDARALLPNLPCSPGMTTWQVTDQKGAVVPAPSENAHEALFPLRDPPADMDLTRCMRLMPEHCNGGGFFVAVFDKVADWEFPKAIRAADEAEEADRERQRLARRGVNTAEEVAADMAQRIPPQFVTPADVQTRAITDFYGLSTFPIENLVVRTPPGERVVREDPNTNVNLVSNAVLRVLRSKSDRVRIVSAGLRALANEHLNSSWRIAYEAAGVFERLMEASPKRLLVVDRSLVIRLMVGGKLKDIKIPDLPAGVRETVEALEMGTVLLRIALDKDGTRAGVAVALRARSCLQLLVDKEDVIELQFRLGITDEELKEAAIANQQEESAKQK